MPEPEPPKGRGRTLLILLSGIAIAAGLSALASMGAQERAVSIRYDELKQYVRERRVESVTLGETETTRHSYSRAYRHSA